MNDKHDSGINEFSFEQSAGPEIEAQRTWVALHSTNQLDVAPIFSDDRRLQCNVWLNDVRAIKNGDTYDIGNHASLPIPKASIHYYDSHAGGGFRDVKSGKLYIDHYDLSKQQLTFHFESYIEQNGLPIALASHGNINEIIESSKLPAEARKIFE
ncbi:hypothetical protein QF019_004782 [Pseudomonas frederiksbergensis]|uniref:hypothetical protein n=1 Tax=Pseudomonas frederiksbergensis TaxID=104087 RepID=UPI003D244B08